MNAKAQAKELTKTIRGGFLCWQYAIYWRDMQGEFFAEYFETREEWDARAAELGWKGK